MALSVKVYDNGDHACLVWLPTDLQPIPQCRGFAIQRTLNGTQQSFLSIQSDLPDATWHQTRADVYIFEQRNARDLKVEQAEQTDATSMHMDNAFQRGMGSNPYAVVMDWTDVHAERMHEFIYFIAAAVIGLALSCLIEAARPWLSAGR